MPFVSTVTLLQYFWLRHFVLAVVECAYFMVHQVLVCWRYLKLCSASRWIVCKFLFLQETCNVVGFSEVENCLANGHSLFLSSLSLISLLLSLVSHTHSYHSIYICFIATENSSVFNLRCMELVQHNHIHSIHWPFTHPFACKHIHIQLTIHSYHRHMLSYHYIYIYIYYIHVLTSRTRARSYYICVLTSRMTARLYICVLTSRTRARPYYICVLTNRTTARLYICVLTFSNNLNKRKSINIIIYVC